MATYQSAYSGPQIDAAVAFGMAPDAAPTQNSTKGVTSGGVYSELKAVGNAVAVLENDINGVKNALNADHHATNGYVPRATSDSQDGFTWEAPGTPTDAQVQEVVDAWMDDHSASYLVALSKAIVNIANFVDGQLDSGNIDTAVAKALEQSSRIYIPAGEYSCSIIISNKKCEIYLDGGCLLTPKNVSHAIYASNCEIAIHGGTFYEGDNVFGSINSENRVETSPSSIIYLSNCANSIIDGITVTHSKRAKVIGINSCENVEITRCNISNVLHNAVAITGSKCRNIKIANCRFTNSYVFSYYDNNALKTDGYCYFVSTGDTLDGTVANTYIPPDQLIFENNYCYGSEDCALDTHGATNVVFRNNTILETICAITAYNDNRRMYRPKINQATGEIDNVNGVQWTMHGILIENNWCESSKAEKTGYNDYPHPFIFLGSANSHSSTESDYAHNPGSFDAFADCVVQGNYFRSPSKVGALNNNGLIQIAYMSRNISIKNNYIDCMGSGSPPTRLYNCIGFEFCDNTVRNAANVSIQASIGRAERNTGISISWNTGFAYWQGDPGSRFGRNDFYLAAPGDIRLSEGKAYICVNDYGLRPDTDSRLGGLNGSRRKFNITVSNGVAFQSDGTSPKIPYITCVVGGTNYYIREVLDLNRFVLSDASGNLLADGTYNNVQIPTASWVEITYVPT